MPKAAQVINRLRVAHGPTHNRLNKPCPYDHNHLNDKGCHLEKLFNRIGTNNTVTPDKVKRIIVEYGKGLEDHLIKFGSVNLLGMCTINSKMSKANMG